VWIINNERKELIRKGYYCDYHMLRPYEGKNKNHVDEVVRTLLNENDTIMETHLTVLKSIFKYVDVNNCVEFGSDSTDILIKNCKYLMSIEMNSQELYDKAREEFKEYKHWDFLLRLGKDSYREIEYPKIDLCLVDGHEDSRPECVNLMLQKQVPIIVVHDTEQPRNRINDNTYYSITYNKTTPWTTVFTSDQNLAYYLSQDLA
jgi:predicted O-methyltransferase YrrM